MSETGSVKFTCQKVAGDIVPFTGLDQLNAHRRKLLELGMIGLDASGIGFGNLSVRDGATTRFYITGSSTGGISELRPSDYARVVAYDFEKNWLQCEGLRVASSESLTHAAVYESEPQAGGVIHCHDMKLWTSLLDQAPTTRTGVEYGTPEMAREVRRLFNLTELKSKKIFVMASHEGGLVTFGGDLAEAFGVLMRYLAKLRSETLRAQPL
jgi:ribulose-5-phosphate 4-epimerase/fuculose-1-phosphate aldolase